MSDAEKARALERLVDELAEGRLKVLEFADAAIDVARGINPYVED